MLVDVFSKACVREYVSELSHPACETRGKEKNQRVGGDREARNRSHIRVSDAA